MSFTVRGEQDSEPDCFQLWDVSLLLGSGGELKDRSEMFRGLRCKYQSQ